MSGGTGIAIERDGAGVPHVRASTDADLYRGLGHCHATDRALQMLLVRILGRGHGSEVLAGDERMLRLDRFFRRLGLAAGADAEAAKLGAAELALAQAYCDGVNEVLERRVPAELRMLRHRPEPWTLADSVLASRVIAYVSLAEGQADLERMIVEMVQGGIPTGHLEALFPGRLGDLDEDLVRSVRLGERLVPDDLRWASALPHAVASNNWVIAPSRTARGAPILANDPHLECNRLPAVWYEAVLEVGERWCAAATMPGLPGPLIGRSNDLAWGATYTYMDAVDSWVEECRDGCYLRVEDGAERWLEFRVRTETIRRKGAPDEVLTVFENDHGVLAGDPRVPGRYLTTRWSSADTGAASLRANLGMFRARSVEEGRALLGSIETAWNWVLADGAGSIGYQMSGLAPRRAAGTGGLAPLPGWDPANDWQGFHPPEDLPRALDPPEGFIVTANDDLNHLGRTDPIAVSMGSYRAGRIAARLAERSDWSVAETQWLQMECRSAQAERLMELIAPLLPATAQGDALRAWDFRYEPDSIGASLFEVVYSALLEAAFGDALGGEVWRHISSETPLLADYHASFDRVLLDPESPWWGPRGRAAAAADAVRRALDGAPLVAWGERNQFVMRHLLLGDRLPRRLGFDRGPFPLRGGRATIHQGQLFRSGGRQSSFAPSYRMVTDLSADETWTTLAGGPSDRRFSRWYASGVADWLAGRFKRLAPRRAVSPAGPSSGPRFRA